MPSRWNLSGALPIAHRTELRSVLGRGGAREHVRAADVGVSGAQMPSGVAGAREFPRFDALSQVLSQVLSDR